MYVKRVINLLCKYEVYMQKQYKFRSLSFKLSSIEQILILCIYCLPYSFAFTTLIALLFWCLKVKK